MLEGLVAHPEIREITPTTQRLVERCLAGDWHISKSGTLDAEPAHTGLSRTASPSIVDQGLSPIPTPAVPRPGVARQRSLKGSRSVEHLRPPPQMAAAAPHHRLEALRAANESAASLPALSKARAHAHAHVHAHAHAHASLDRRDAVLRANSLGTVMDAPVSPAPHYHSAPASAQLPALPTSPLPMTPTTPLPSILEPPLSPASASSVPASFAVESRRSSVSSTHSMPGAVTPSGKPRRSAPPPPVKRRKPPAVPVRAGQGPVTVAMTNGGARIETIRSSNSAPVVGRAA
jgi:hypothetical protein